MADKSLFVMLIGMIGQHPYHLHRIRFTELDELYASETLKVVAYSLIGIFIPIFLLKNGVSLGELCLLFAMQNAIRFTIEPLVGRLIARRGAKHMLAYSYPLSFVYILLLALYPTYQVHLSIIAIIWAISDSLHWVSYQSVFSKSKNSKKSGSQIAHMHILGVLAGAIGPITAGLLASQYGLRILFYISPILLLIATWPLLTTRETVQSKRLNYKGIFSRAKGDMAAHAALSFDVVIGTILWPLFIYLIVQDYVKLGSIISLSFLVSIMALISIGKISDKLDKKMLVRIGSGAMSAVNVLRHSAGSFMQAFGINIAATIFGPLLSTPLFSLFYSHADKSRRIEYTVLMEMAGDASRATFWVALFFLSLIAEGLLFFKTAFLIGAVVILGTNMVSRSLVNRRET